MSPVLPKLPAQFAQALELIDDAHAQDKREAKNVGDEKVPYELHYAKKMTSWLATRCPEASPVLQVACRAQHFRRWEIPRDSFPMTRPGYLTWRAKQKAQAASQVVDLLGTSAIQPAIPEEDRARVAALIRKEKLDSDPEAQALEDVACLVFLDNHFDDFEKRDDVDEDKMINILSKTWGKMSPRGREIALEMKLSDRAKVLIGKALASA
ncbi:glutamyl-tRNA synthetase [Cordyceps militaris CM01]|uniref:Glutamyl-tRNA synthetase n=2 Tax=Cordyceps militaris TaxID=73501 RepID=G3JD73_CORMM|nr:glutamyl-tRNA synthetase [Cordyceps militaris CM01]ATY67056.1 glutamyl-tRNA synthetase [Cordyceps militaris]EGX92548.1 glutamyl-tRNA synthetase [Cordyceps militaris CM01]